MTPLSLVGGMSAAHPVLALWLPMRRSAAQGPEAIVTKPHPAGPKKVPRPSLSSHMTRVGHSFCEPRDYEPLP